jgi:hypothetical protein
VGVCFNKTIILYWHRVGIVIFPKYFFKIIPGKKTKSAKSSVPKKRVATTKKKTVKKATPKKANYLVCCIEIKNREQLL